MNKLGLSERDICSKFITPALVSSGWDLQSQIREEVTFTKGRVIVRGKMTTRGESKRADYILYHTSGVPLALIEAKDKSRPVGVGMQQTLGYAETLQIPFVFSTNGDAFLFHDRTLTEGTVERAVPLDAFPSPRELWNRYTDAQGIPTARLSMVAQPFHDDGSGKHPRYYQTIAVNRAVEANWRPTSPGSALITRPGGSSTNMCCCSTRGPITGAKPCGGSRWISRWTTRCFIAASVFSGSSQLLPRGNN